MKHTCTLHTPVGPASTVEYACTTPRMSGNDIEKRAREQLPRAHRRETKHFEFDPGNQSHLFSFRKQVLRCPGLIMEYRDYPFRSSTHYAECLQLSANHVIQHLGRGDVALVLGSGLGGFGDTLEEKQVLPYEEIPYMPVPHVVGHKGALIRGRIGNKWVLCFSGRSHAYEGHHPLVVTYAARLSVLVGCRLLLLTNASGGVNKNFVPGTFVMMKDHLNTTRRSSFEPVCTEKAFYEGVERNPDCQYVWSHRIVDLGMEIGRELSLPVGQGVYALTSGPQYETVPEVQLTWHSGADCVGMSTVPEALAAAAMGLEVAAISVVTNPAAGISLTELNHEEVKEQANLSARQFERLVKELIDRVELLAAPEVSLSNLLPDAEAQKNLTQPLPPADLEPVARALFDHYEDIDLSQVKLCVLASPLHHQLVDGVKAENTFTMPTVDCTLYLVTDELLIAIPERSWNDSAALAVVSGIARLFNDGQLASLEGVLCTMTAWDCTEIGAGAGDKSSGAVEIRTFDHCFNYAHALWYSPTNTTSERKSFYDVKPSRRFSSCVMEWSSGGLVVPSESERRLAHNCGMNAVTVDRLGPYLYANVIFAGTRVKLGMRSVVFPGTTAPRFVTAAVRSAISAAIAGITAGSFDSTIAIGNGLCRWTDLEAEWAPKNRIDAISRPDMGRMEYIRSYAEKHITPYLTQERTNIILDIDNVLDMEEMQEWTRVYREPESGALSLFSHTSGRVTVCRCNSSLSTLLTVSRALAKSSNVSRITVLCRAHVDLGGAELCIVRAQCNFSGHSLLRGPNDEALGLRFQDMSHPFVDFDFLQKTLPTAKLSTFIGVAGDYGFYTEQCLLDMAKAAECQDYSYRLIPVVIALRHAGAKRLGAVSAQTPHGAVSGIRGLVAAMIAEQ